MLYREFGTTSWKISAIGMGTWNIGNQWGKVEEATSWATIRTAFEQGVNLFDTAESYGIPNGLSEERLGTALAGIRHQVYIVSKIGFWGGRTGQGVPKTTVDLIRLCAHASLHRLRTDWLDVILCHEAKIEDPTVYLETFETLKQRGRIRIYGISTDSLEVLKRFNVNGTCSVVEFDYSLLNRTPESKLLPYCQKNNIAVLIRGPLGMGLLSGKYSVGTVFTDKVRSQWHTSEAGQDEFENKIAKVEKLKGTLQPGKEMVTAALRFVISHPTCPVALPGAKSPLQATVNAAAGAKTLTEDELLSLVSLID